MAMLGYLSEFSLPDILQIFERAMKTGQLSVWAPSGIYRIFFYQGQVAATIAPQSNYQLKQILLSSGQLSPDSIAYLQNLSGLQTPLGTLLKKQGLVKASTLKIAFRKQIQVGIYSLLQLQAGQFRFANHEPFPYEEMTGLSQGGMEVALEGLRHIESLDRNDAKLPQPGSSVVRIPQELPHLRLSTLEWSIWRNTAAAIKIADLSLAAQANLLDVRRACRRLTQIGLLDEVMTTPISSKPSLIETHPASPSIGAKEKDIPLGLVAQTAKDSPSTEIHPTLLDRLAMLLRSAC